MRSSSHAAEHSGRRDRAPLGALGALAAASLAPTVVTLAPAAAAAPAAAVARSAALAPHDLTAAPNPGAAPACGDPAADGRTAVGLPALHVRFLLPQYWLCVPGKGPLPVTITVLERVDPNVTALVPALRKNAVGAFELLPGGKIPVVLTVDQIGTGPLPTPSTWSQLIGAQAQVQGTTLTGLHVVPVRVPAGRFLEATFTFSNPGGATFFRAELLGSIAGKLVSAVFQGSPTGSADVRAQAELVMGTFR